MDDQDPFLGIQGLIDAGKLYAGDLDRTSYVVSPIYGELHGLAPISVFVGTRDIMVADCRKLRHLAARANIPLDYHEFEDMVHDWMLFPLPEANEAIRKIEETIK